MIKPIPSLENYLADEYGNIYSRNWKRTGETRKLKPTLKNKGYAVVTLRNNGKQLKARVHRLIWTAFHGDIPDGLEINHINEKRDDNRLENLELLTHRENLNYGNRKEKHN